MSYAAIAAMPGLSGRTSEWNIRWGNCKSRPPRFFHDPQRGLKFVNAKREFQPHRPRILEDWIPLLFDHFETDQNTGTSGLHVGSSRLEIDGLAWGSNHHGLPLSTSAFRAT